MKRALFALLCLSGTAVSQGPATLLFTTLNQTGPEQTLSGTSGTSLAAIGSQDVMAMVPEPGASNSAENA